MVVAYRKIYSIAHSIVKHRNSNQLESKTPATASRLGVPSSAKVSTLIFNLILPTCQSCLSILTSFVHCDRNLCTALSSESMRLGSVKDVMSLTLDDIMGYFMPQFTKLLLKRVREAYVRSPPATP